MSLSGTSLSSSFMKAPRAHYRMRGGKIFAGLLLLLCLLLALLILKADSHFFGDVSPKRTVFLVLFDLSLMLLLMVYVVQHRARLLWTRAHDGVLGTRLQSRIILMFSGIAIMPTLVVATFSILFFNVRHQILVRYSSIGRTRGFGGGGNGLYRGA